MKVWIAFGTLCVLSASGWLVGEYFELPFSGLLRICLHAALLCVLLLLLARPGRELGMRLVRVFGWASALLGVPAVALQWSGGRVGELTGVLVFSLVPVFTVFFAGQRKAGFGEGGDALARIVPALAGVAGAALLLPFSAPVSVAGWVWLVALMISAMVSGYAGIRLHEELAGIPVTAGAAMLSGAAAVSAGLFLWLPRAAVQVVSGRGVAEELGVCLLLDGPVFLLTAWLLQEMGPVGFSSRFLLVPLVTIAEGFVLMRPELTGAMLAGALLLVGGSGMLLRNEDSR